MIKDHLVFLNHIRDAIKLIKKFIQSYDEKTFMHNALVHSAVVRQLEIVGEAAKNLPEKFTKSHPEVPWSDMAGMRDKLIHAYFGVDLRRVWKVATKDLPVLEKQIEAIIDEEKTTNS